MNITTTRFARTGLALVTAAVLAACASSPDVNPKLEDARAAYNTAATDPVVVQSAVAELKQAQEALQKADMAAKNGDGTEQVNHYAYLAKQRTQIALEAGRIAKADKAAAQSKGQRDQILIEARTREAEQAKAQAEAAAARAGSLEAQMAAMKAKPTERGMVLTLGDVLFDTGRANLKPGAARNVDQLAQFLKGNPSRKILVEGHTDSTGSASLNQELSLHRAEAVQHALVQQGVSMDRIQVSGLGKDFPVASNGTASGRAQNRRVEVIFSDEAGAIKARAAK